MKSCHEAVADLTPRFNSYSLTVARKSSNTVPISSIIKIERFFSFSMAFIHYYYDSYLIRYYLKQIMRGKPSSCEAGNPSKG